MDRKMVFAGSPGMPENNVVANRADLALGKMLGAPYDAAVQP